MIYKKYCKTHHFYYDGNHCPYCLLDDASMMYENFVKNKKNKDYSEIRQSDLEKLMQKFNKQ